MSYQQFDPPGPTDDPDQDNVAEITEFSAFGLKRPRIKPTPKTNELRIERHGITWVMDLVPHGTYANGDPWVVGPVKIKQILPGSSTITYPEGVRYINGSEINPSPANGLFQGFDSEMYSVNGSGGPTGLRGLYSAELDWGRKLLSSSDGLILEPRQSLVSTVSKTALARPNVKAAAVLTCVSGRPAATAFRPGYADGRKSHAFTTADIDFDVLGAQGGVVDGTSGGATPPTNLDTERWTEGLWLDHVPEWITRYLHPQQNQADYSQEVCEQFSAATMLANCSDYTHEQMTDTIINCIQKGIDMQSVLDSPGSTRVETNIDGITYVESPWVAGDGQSNGIYWRILFAGLMLDDWNMKNVGLKNGSTGTGADFSTVFQGENGQCFTVAETSNGVYNWGHGGYVAGDVGLAEWGPKHVTRPDKDGKALTSSAYRTCCTASSWYGQALSCLLMNGSDEWNHAPFFDYMDRYRALATTHGWTGLNLGGRSTYSHWCKDMWDEHRLGLT
jgi:hypothetical protein